MLVREMNEASVGSVKIEEVQLLTRDNWIGKFCYVVKDQGFEDNDPRDTVRYHVGSGRWNRSAYLLSESLRPDDEETFDEEVQEWMMKRTNMWMIGQTQRRSRLKTF